jgi:hypothetical protein
MFTLTMQRTSSPAYSLPCDGVDHLADDGLVALVSIQDLGIDLNRDPLPPVIVIRIAQ